MSIAAQVILWGTRIGTVALDDGEDAAIFEYDRDFLLSGMQLSPLEMPLARRVYSFPALARESFHGLPGLLADSLPDKFGNAVIDAWLDSQGRPRGSMNAVERLCYTGVRGMGALEFQPTIGPDPAKSDELDLDHLTKLAQDVLNARKGIRISQDEEAMAQIIRVGSSAGGARAKALIAWNEQTGDIRSGQVNAGEGYTYWLLKFDGMDGNADKEDDDAPCYTRIEYAYHLMAVDAGIQMSECRLYEESGRHHFLTKRFDRTDSGEKLHMQTLGAIAHFDFNQAGAYSYEQAVDVARNLGLGQAEVEQLYRRMVLNVMARNNDDHVKNISFLMNKRGVWSLAPAYDVTYAYNPHGAWTGRHQMTVNGKRDDISYDDLLACAGHMSISARRAKAIVEGVRRAVKSWRSYAEKAGLEEAQAVAIETAFVDF